MYCSSGSSNFNKVTVLSTKRVENVVFQSSDIFSVMVHAIETQDIPTGSPKNTD